MTQTMANEGLNTRDGVRLRTLSLRQGYVTLWVHGVQAWWPERRELR